MTPTLTGRLQTRIFLAATIGVLWTAAITPALPRPAGMSSAFAYHVTFEALGLMTLLGLGWEAVYHVLQQARWDKDWPSVFALLAVIPEAIPLWYVTHILNVIPGTTRLSSPIVPLYVIHVSTTWMLTWMFMQGPLRVLHLRWRFEGGLVLVRAPGRFRRRSTWPGFAEPGTGEGRAIAAPTTGPVPVAGPAQPALTTATVARPGLTAAQPRAAGNDAARAGVPAAGVGNLAEGMLCQHGHFSHPDARYCVVCGSAIPPLGGPPALGPPPPAGILILPDGGTTVLGHDLTVTAPASSGDLGFLPLGEHPQAVAHIRMVGWQPVVSSPAHSLLLLLPGGSQLRAERGVPVPLVPGAELAICGHRIRYESPHFSGPLSPAPAVVSELPRPAAALEPVPSSRRAGASGRRRQAAALVAAAAALGAPLRLAAGRAAAIGRMAREWITGKPGRGARRTVAAGTAIAIAAAAIMLGFADHLADASGPRLPAAGPGQSPPSAAAAPGTRGPRPGTGPGSSVSPAGYSIAAPPSSGRAAQPGRPARSWPGHPGTTSTPGSSSPPASPTPPRSPTPAPTHTGSPSPSPSPTSTRSTAPGSCLKVLLLRVCGP
jgi:hypothetical protein